MQITDGRHLEMINDGMGFLPREAAIIDHPAVAQLHRASLMPIPPISDRGALDAWQTQQIQRALPDPTVTGPCQAQAHWTCTGQAQGERLNPLAMLPGSTVPAGYVPMCQACYDHLADQFVAARHA